MSRSSAGIPSSSDPRRARSRPGDRHLRSCGRALLALAIACGSLNAGPVDAAAGDKESRHEEMTRLAKRIARLKADPSQGERAARLRERYEQLSASLGGDDPGALVGAAAAPRARSRGNGVVPPNCVASVDTVVSQDTPVAIPDGPGGLASSSITVSGVRPYLQDLDLFTDLPHTFAADLDITVTSPAGTEMTLTTDNGSGNDNVFAGTTWDDDAGDTNAPGPVSDNVFEDLVLETPLVPEEALAAFIGEDPNGTWTITIVDDAEADTGTLESWSLTLITLPSAPIFDPPILVTATDTPIDIPDFPGGEASSSLAISGVNTFACAVALFMEIPHTFASDLEITLLSAAGTEMTLTTRNGAGNDDVFDGTDWGDSAGDINPPGPVTDNVFEDLVAETPLVPEEALGAYIGEDPNGTWTLTVDDVAAEDIGTLEAWVLAVGTCRCVEETEVFSPVALEVDTDAIGSDGNGVLEPGETADAAPVWRNDGTLAQTVSGTASNLTGPPGPEYILLDEAAAYGTVDPGATASCQDLSDCYEFAIGPPGVERPVLHWDASFDETLSEQSAATWALHIGDSFADVPRSSLFYSAVETFLHNGVSSDPLLARRDLPVVGCSDTEFCPAQPNTRAEAAVFLLKALEGGGFDPPDCVSGSELFGDVPAADPFCPWIEELAGRSVTAGCGGGNYCPDDSVSRDQIAVFLLKTLEDPGYTPPACTGVFDDVSCPSLFADWVEDLFARGITAGCGGGSYCPTDAVRRAQTAALAVRAFELALYGP